MSTHIIVDKLSKHFTTYIKDPGLMGSVKSLFYRKVKTIPAVDNISFEISPGELVGFIGPNGAGKTTTLKMLSGLLLPTSGKCSVLGYNPFNREQKFLQRISLIMGQKSQLWPDLPAIETFELNREIYQVSQSDYHSILDQMVTMLGVEEVIYQQARKMSLGQRMKCELIASLLYRPEILFLDEPTLGLDVLVQKKLRKFIRDYNAKYNSTVLLTSHYMDDVKEICQRVIIINHGTLVYDGTVVNLIKQHADYKIITLILNQEVDRDKLAKYGLVCEIDGPRVVFNIPRAEVSRSAGKLLTDFDVDDLDIGEPRLEDIISEIFEDKQ